MNPLIRRLAKLENSDAAGAAAAGDLGWADGVLAQHAQINVDEILCRRLMSHGGWESANPAVSAPTTADLERARVIRDRLNPGREQAAEQRSADVVELIERRLALCSVEMEDSPDE
jgi:hypothetical protein